MAVSNNESSRDEIARLELRMSYEVACGECGETILIEELGVEVHCPHCDTTLVLTEEDVRLAQAENGTTESESAESGGAAEAVSASGLEDTLADVGASSDLPGATTEFGSESTEEDSPNFDFTGESANLDETVELTGFSIRTGDSEIGGAGAPGTGGAEAEIVDEEPRSFARRRTDISKTVMMSLVSYSVLSTIVVLYLFYRLKTGAPHQLESLPDVPQPEGNQFSVYRENASLAPGHTLRLGETQRFGNVEITPLEVTRERIQFRHFQNRRTGALPPTEPVLKLWLEVKNVSEDQVFRPFDKELINLRRPDEDDIYRVRANNWICRASDLPTLDHRILMYDLPPASEFDIDGMVVRRLKPGESAKTFLPSQEDDLERLKGDLVWRFQMRKGFHAETMHGVTTLVEVLFNSDDVTANHDGI